MIQYDSMDIHGKWMEHGQWQWMENDGGGDVDASAPVCAVALVAVFQDQQDLRTGQYRELESGGISED